VTGGLAGLLIRYAALVVGTTGLFVGAAAGLCLVGPALGAAAWWSLGPVTVACAVGCGLAAVRGLQAALRPRAESVSLQRLARYWLAAWLAGGAAAALLGWVTGSEPVSAVALGLALCAAGALALWTNGPERP